MSLLVDEHRQYLADHARVSAFQRAIGEVVKPGDVALDLGAGTGILGMFACRAGAKRVYSIEDGGIIELAREISRANGFQERQQFLKGLSTRVDLPEKVDVIVTDQIGHFGFEAGLLEYLADARTRFLEPGGVMMPSRVTLLAVPVESSELWDQVEFWSRPLAGLDFHAARSLAANTGYPVKFRAEQLLGEPVPLMSFELLTAVSAPARTEQSAVVTRSGTFHGIGGWFSAQLSPSVLMSNSPVVPQRINRSNVFFPIDQPPAVEKGDEVRISLHILPSEVMVMLKVEVWRNGKLPAGELKARFSHSTLHGMLICQEDLQRTLPHFVPKLSAWGEARRTILELCNGERTLAEIEQEVYRRHPMLFRSLGQAQGFVAEVVSRYTV